MELNKENLYNEYIVKNKTAKECMKIFNCSKDKIVKLARENNYMKNGINSNKKNTEDMRIQVTNGMGKDYVLCSEYKNATTKITVLHTVCNKKFSFKPTTIKTKNKYRECPFCREKRKMIISDEQFRYEFENGMTGSEFSLKYGKDRSFFYTRAKKLGLQRTEQAQVLVDNKISNVRTIQHTKYNIDKQYVIDMLGKGETFSTIAKRYDCSNSAIYFFVKRNDLFKYRDVEKWKFNRKKALAKTLKERYGVSNLMYIQEYKDKAFTNKKDIHASKAELELKKYVEDIYGHPVTRLHDSSLELDIYIPEKKLGIEYNGNYWHSLKNKDKNYHYNKSKHFEEKGIRVIHIWEYEWNNERQRPILENIIKNALGLNMEKVYARKCSIEVRPSASMKDFFNKNNIQGFRGGKFAICLVYNNEVIMAYMMGHCYFGKGKYEWEVIRGATKLGYTVVGGASKIWKYFIENYNPANCVYYIDYNYFNGNSLPYLGLTYLKSQPGFKNWWVKTNTVKNREPQRHKEIKELYKKGEVVPIYNAGTKVYVWENHSIKLGNDTEK